MFRTRVTVSATLCCLVACTMAIAADESIQETDIAYYGDAPPDSYARSRCRLDVLAPTDQPNFATIVWFHGGGLRVGNRHTGGNVAKRFNAEGIGIVLVDYRLSPKATCPAYIEDAAAAVAWTVKNIQRFGGEPNKVFVAGHSAGGYLTAMVGLAPSYLAKHGIATSQLAGLIPISGQMITHSTIRDERGISERRPIIDAFAPAYYAAKKTPHCLCIVGDQDLPARLEENTYATAAFKAFGNTKFTCHVFHRRDHATIVSRILQRDDEVAAAMAAFIQKVSRMR